jgi:hypothetical protein
MAATFSHSPDKTAFSSRFKMSNNFLACLIVVNGLAHGAPPRPPFAKQFSMLNHPCFRVTKKFSRADNFIDSQKEIPFDQAVVVGARSWNWAWT